LFNEYPAHLHINCHPSSRGKGVGSELLKHFFYKLKKIDSVGCHVVTTTSSLNVSFYKKNGFNFELEKQYNNSPLLFMGRRVSDMVGFIS
jgi:GNAT superfamily N-acetyltransferase